MPYEPIIGLEIHIQLNTRSKIFCACPADSWGAPPNTNICPVCCGLPGVLPVLNRAVVEKAVLLAAAVHCAEIQPQSFFDRKNYFYPDLPKGYQITQYDEPIGRRGRFEVPLPDGSTREISIAKMHMEEDAGKTKNDSERGARLIDMNRCGVPLVEMVTGPDLRSADEAARFLMRLRQLLRWLDVSEANMERAQVRCDANVSIREIGTQALNRKTEIKNVNSIEAVRDAIQTEVERQVREVSAGRRVEAWTLEWDEDNQSLKKMRSKETEADYRYFREPDLLALQVDPAWREQILRRLPELPAERYARFMDQYRLPAYDAGILTEERSLSDYFEEALRQRGAQGDPKTISNWVQNEVLRLLKEQNLLAGQLAFTPAHLAELVGLVEDKTITRQTAVALIPKVMASGQPPRALVASEGLAQISGDEALRELARQVIAENPREVEAYRAKPTLLKWFVGQVMKKSKSKANAQVVEQILGEMLGSMITIRPAIARDQETIVAIIRAADINPMDLKWPKFAVAVDEASGAIVATGQIKKHGDGSRELASIATVPEYQHQGIAHQVIQYLLARHTGVLYLTCLDTMGPFYVQFGFRVIETAEMTPYFRRLKRIVSAMHFLSAQGRQLLVMKRE